jgi:hypothetical protein
MTDGTLKTIMQTEHDDTGAQMRFQLDDKGRLYVNNQRVATKLDLNRNTLIPLWIAAVGAAVQGIVSVCQYFWP